MVQHIDRAAAKQSLTPEMRVACTDLLRWIFCSATCGVWIRSGAHSRDIIPTINSVWGKIGHRNPLINEQLSPSAQDQKRYVIALCLFYRRYKAKCQQGATANLPNLAAIGRTVEIYERKGTVNQPEACNLLLAIFDHGVHASSMVMEAGKRTREVLEELRWKHSAHEALANASPIAARQLWVKVQMPRNLSFESLPDLQNQCLSNQ